MYAAFGSNKPLVIAVLVLPAVLLAWLTATFLPLPEYPLAGELFVFLHGMIGSAPIVNLIIGTILELVFAAFLAHLCNVHHIHRRENYFTALVCFLFLSCQLSFNYFNPIVLALVFVLVAMSQMLSLFRADGITHKLFVGGFFMGLAILIYPPFIVLSPILWISLSMLRPFQIREFMLPGTGLITPIIYLAFYHFWISEPLPWEHYFDFGDGHGFKPFLGLTTFEVIYSLASAIIVLIGLLSFVGAMNASTVQKKNTKGVLIILATLLLVVWIYLELLLGTSSSFSAVIALPVAVFSAYTFSNNERPVISILAYYFWLVLTIIWVLRVLFV